MHMDTNLSCAELTGGAPLPHVGRATPLRVVIVEDSERILVRLRESLQDIDNVAVTGEARTEPEALALMRSVEWDLAIVDLQLREGSGLRVLKALHDDPSGTAGQIAVFTNYAFPQYRERSLALGADHFFDKSREFGRVLALAEQMAVG